MLNFKNKGFPICKIKGGEYNNKIISVDTKNDDEETAGYFNKLDLPAKYKGAFQQVINEDLERFVGYITGPSGSGKSTYVKNLVLELKKVNKKIEVYIFSAITDDPSLEEIKPNRIKLDNTLVTDPIKVSDFKNSLVIFDDIDVISDKPIRLAVYSLLDQILEIGRHDKINCLVTNHLPTSGKETRRILNECHFVVYFPHSGSKRGLKYLLEDYIGLDKNDIKKIKNLKSRWCMIYKNFPQIALCEKNIFILADDD